ncbi:hypothetical protein [Propionivibrio dicarboxylicus]|uniref:Uncharacterized protein n=1 Tax=Propionivibrio dicarboxylicus TaxID=83767 RepID=A0A1G8EM81_9RHOO|nr:hypothetical protein [Propionivibrio dicarboxylicus]SDH70902.1 hypothetical protein SAMN05660652_02125 [Propionivibrio dicarboxylicus]
MQVIIIVALIVCGLTYCNRKDPAQELIHVTAHSDWEKSFNAEDLAQTLKLCGSSQSSDCTKVKDRAQAVADAVASCVGNDSTLCQTVTNTEQLRQFKGGRAMPLPNHPFYWRIGNELLDTVGPLLNYRDEMWSEWCYRWRDTWRFLATAVLAVSSVLIIVVVRRRWQLQRQDTADKRALEEAERQAKAVRKRAEQERAKAEATRREQEAASEAAEAAARVEATRKAQDAARAATEAAARIEAEARAEAQQVKEATAAALAAAFKIPKR